MVPVVCVRVIREQGGEFDSSKATLRHMCPTPIPGGDVLFALLLLLLLLLLFLLLLLLRLLLL